MACGGREVLFVTFLVVFVVSLISGRRAVGARSGESGLSRGRAPCVHDRGLLRAIGRWRQTSDASVE